MLLPTRFMSSVAGAQTLIVSRKHLCSSLVMSHLQIKMMGTQSIVCQAMPVNRPAPSKAAPQQTGPLARPCWWLQPGDWQADCIHAIALLPGAALSDSVLSLSQPDQVLGVVNVLSALGSFTVVETATDDCGCLAL